jgi:hypothetical protein
MFEEKKNLYFCLESSSHLGDASLVSITTHLPDTHSFYITHCAVDDLKTTSMGVKIISVIIYIFQIICKFKLRMFHQVWGTRWRSWLMHCATSWKVAGSIFDGVIGIFH